MDNFTYTINNALYVVLEHMNIVLLLQVFFFTMEKGKHKIWSGLQKEVFIAFSITCTWQPITFASGFGSFCSLSYATNKARDQLLEYEKLNSPGVMM